LPEESIEAQDCTKMLEQWGEGMSKTKVCRKCGEKKSVSEFYKQKSNKDGFNNACKKCIGVMRSEYYYKNIEIIRGRNQEYYSNNVDSIKCKNQEYRESHREERSTREANYRVVHKGEINTKERERYIRLPTKRNNGMKYYVSNKEEILDNRVEYYVSNREDILKIRSEYSKTPRGKAVGARAGHKRRSKDKNLKNTLTLKQWNKILKMQNNKCADCGKEFNENLIPHRDHIIPLSNPACPGLTFGNVQALCHSCNCKKHTSVDFMRAIDNLLVKE
jgi:5-methylcytosine-specific restriction endonuclease McrA